MINVYALSITVLIMFSALVGWFVIALFLWLFTKLAQMGGEK